MILNIVAALLYFVLYIMALALQQQKLQTHSTIVFVNKDGRRVNNIDI